MRMNDAHAPGKRDSKCSSAGATGERALRSERDTTAKRPINLSVRGDLIDAARAARVNLSTLLERALSEELVRLKWRQWREENRPAAAVYNRHVKENGAFCRISLRL